MRLLPFFLLLSAANAADSKIQYAKITAPCALDRDAKPLIVRAMMAQDNEALAGLVERGKAIVLTKGTRFAIAGSSGDGFVLGNVRSGRQVGRDCYMMQAFLQDQPPAAKK